MKIGHLLFLWLIFCPLAFGFEAEVGSHQDQYRYYSRESLLTGREQDFRHEESVQWGKMGFAWGKHRFSAEKKQITEKSLNRIDGVLDQRVSEEIIPRWDYHKKNLQLSLWREILSPLEQNGTYGLAWAENKQFPLDNLRAKVEKNREYIEFNLGFDRDRKLIEGSQIEQRYYLWQEFALGAYNQRQRGWRINLRQRQEVFPVVLAQKNWLTGFEYKNDQPAKPSTQAYWKSSLFKVEQYMLGETVGIAVRLENDFTFMLADSQQIIGLHLKLSSLKESFDQTDYQTPYRVDAAGGELRESLVYQGQTHLWSSPILLGWSYRYTDLPVMATYRGDQFEIFLAFNY